MTGVSLLVGLRYSGARENNAFLSFISKVSLGGLALGVIALTVVVSVMDGFDQQLEYRILGAVPHVVFTAGPGVDVGKLLAGDRKVAGYAPFLRRSGVAIRDDSRQLVSIYGVEPGAEQRMSIIPDHMVQGNLGALKPGSDAVVMGRPLGLALGLDVGDILTLIIPDATSGNTVTPRMARVKVAGFFEVDSDIDYSLLMMNRQDLASIVHDHTSTWRVTLNDVFYAPMLARQLAAKPGISHVSTWKDQYGDFFRTVRMEKIMMFILLTLIVAIAAFNIVSGLSMMVKEKRADIAVFRTMGLSPFAVMRIFMVQGTVAGVLGTVIGLLLGIPLAHYIPHIISFVESLTGTQLLAGTYFSRVPTDVRLPDLSVIAVVSMVLSFLATLYPAWRAAKLRPANVLRYE